MKTFFSQIIYFVACKKDTILAPYKSSIPRMDEYERDGDGIGDYVCNVGCYVCNTEIMYLFVLMSAQLMFI